MLSEEEKKEYLMLLEQENKQKELQKVFTPQKGPQTDFLNSTADIVLFGGAAGGGKTHALLLECLKHYNVHRFSAIVFRDQATQITAPGGLWDAAMKLMPLKGAKPILTPRPTMKFDCGAKIVFSHLQYESDVFAWQGSELTLICFDEFTHFSRSQFLYMLSRNRSTCGIKPYVRATCNPDADSWVAEFIDWWIDDDGYPIPERSGVVRYFTVLNDEFIWGDTREELSKVTGKDEGLLKSFTFIPSKLDDNPILLAINPEYKANLEAMGEVERGRLLDGNWKIKPSAGMYFKKEQATIVNAIPCKLTKIVRAWDLAATIPTPQNPSPDATAGILMGILEDGRYIILNLKHGCWQSSKVRQLVKETAKNDKETYGNVHIRLPQDPGQAGKEQAQSYVLFLSGYPAKTQPVSGDKITRAEPFSSQWQAGNVLVLSAGWNNTLFNEFESFPTGKHDDIVDACSDAFTELQTGYQLHLVSPIVIEKESYWA
ncbi:phage terminase large subunit [Pectinatus frisingensis]|uniref:phage terminase large subunit n=1 Tax=Pectinatus frisingensis TaxID=865 RepID=UPI001E54D866|nr:phage terminase large subunit [Pectinatus frisingensis]